ncbi:MAG: glycosyltransferase [Sphingobacteriales bacterium]|nr:MAG: glycosyltransferase [Sphingobacteriales bacterium]
MKVKIIQITASYKPAYIYGGPIQSVSKLCEALVDYKALDLSKVGEINPREISVLTTTANGKQELNIEGGEEQIIDGVKVTYFRRWTKDHTHFSPPLLIRLNKIISNGKRSKNNEQIIVHIHAWWNLVSVLSCLVAWIHKIPVILSPRGMITPYTKTNRNSYFKKILHATIGKKLLKYCHIHATSEMEKIDIEGIIKAKSVTVIPNLVKIRPSLPINNNRESDELFKMIFLSRIEEKKGLELLFESLKNVNFPWTLTIAGSGSENYIKSLKTIAENLKLVPYINWVGQVANETKFDLLAEHDLCILTSYSENFANVIPESLSVGTAVLLSDKVGLKDYVEAKNSGWITALGTTEIEKNLVAAYQDISKRNFIRKNAPSIIRNDFDDDYLVKRYLDLYTSIAHE